ncbi:MAG: hypothetical protein EAZ27_08270 [Cytophagales bacterium]|nr:MAG: hypothetical protein EAZ27_08270 [Cytophagales bacterium]
MIFFSIFNLKYFFLFSYFIYRRRKLLKKLVFYFYSIFRYFLFLIFVKIENYADVCNTILILNFFKLF